ncbi:MAG: hypothetical protein RR066_03935, partial [Mucinivorans sp.]
VTIGTSNSYCGTLRGWLDLGDNVKLEAYIPLPMSSGACVVGLRKGTVTHFSGLGAMVQAVTGDAITALPTGLATFGACDITKLTFSIDIKQRKVTVINFAMHSTAKWVVATDYLEFANVTTNLHITNSAGLVTTGSVGATIEILGQPIRVVALRGLATMPWRFVLDLPCPLHIPGIGDLASWALPEQFVAKLPSTVMPFASGLDLTAMQVSMNASTGKLEKLTFDIQNSAPWVIIERYLILQKVHVAGEVTDFTTVKKLNLLIVARLAVGEAVILFSTTHRPDKPWILEATLENTIAFDFSKLLAKMNLIDQFATPAGLALPSLTINSISGEAIPAEKRFKFAGDISLTSNITILGLEFRMVNLVAKIDIEGDEKKRVELAAQLVFDTWKIQGAVAFGTVDTPTVFRGSLLSDMTLLSITNTLSPNTLTTLVPTDIKPTTYHSGAIARFDKTANNIAFVSKIDGIGAAFFYATTLPTAPVYLGYIASFALESNFRFTNLFAGLSSVDEVIKVERASILISSYVAQKAEISVVLDDLIAWDGNPLGLVSPLNDAALVPTAHIARGTCIYARMSFGGWIATLLGQITDVEQKSTLSLYASIPHESGKTEFIATLPAISIASGMVAMSAGTTLQYTYSTTEQKFAINGIISLTVFGKKYTFDSHLMVDNVVAIFSAQLKNVDTIKVFPDILPSFFELKEFSLGGGYHFATATTAKHLELILAGRVRLGGMDISAALHTVGGNPIFAYAKLEQSLTFSSIINDIVGTGLAWPDSIFDLTLRADTTARRTMIYYYNPPEGFNSAQLTVPQCVTLVEGYNIEAAIDLTFVATVSFSMLVNVQKNSGVMASVRLENPINLFIVELASTSDAGGKKYLHGPEFYLNSVNKILTFGMRTGLNFLGYGFGTADISVGKTKATDGKQEMLLTAKTETKDVPFFGSLALNFSYTPSRGLRLDGLPAVVNFAEKVIDFAKTLKAIIEAAKCSGDDVCGKLVDGIFDKILYVDNFKLEPGFDCSVNETKVYLTLNGHYIVHSMDFEICDLKFNNIVRIGLGTNSSFDDIGGLVKEALGDIAESLVRAILDNAEACAKMLVLNLGKEAARAAAYLLCMGLIKEITSKAVAAGAAAAAVGGGAAGVATLISVIRGGGGEGGGGETPKEPATPVINGKLELADNKLVIKWHGARYAAKYDVQFLTPSSVVIAQFSDLELGTLQASTVPPNPMGEGIYKAQVCSVRGDKKSVWASSTLEKLATPSVTISLDNASGLISCVSSPEATGATYHFKLKNEAGTELFTSDVTTPTLVVNLSELRGDIKNVHVYLHISKPGGVSSDIVRSESAINPPPPPPPPVPHDKPVTIGVPMRKGAYLVIPWSTKNLAINQRIELEIVTNGVALVLQPAIQYSYGKARIALCDLVSGRPYQFRAHTVYARHSELLFYSPEQLDDELWTISDTTNNNWLKQRCPSVRLADGLVWRKWSQIIDIASQGYGADQLTPPPTFDTSVRILNLHETFFLHLELWNASYSVLSKTTCMSAAAGLLSTSLVNCPTSPRYVYIELAAVMDASFAEASAVIKLSDSATVNENSEWSDLSQIITI